MFSLVHSPQPFLDQHANHLHKFGVSPCAGGANHPDLTLLAKLGRFLIQVKHDFHVITDKTQRHDHQLR